MAAATTDEEFSEQSSSEDEAELKIDEKKQELPTRELAEKIFNTDTDDESYDETIVVDPLSEAEIDKWTKVDTPLSSFQLTDSDKSDESADSDASVPTIRLSRSAKRPKIRLSAKRPKKHNMSDEENESNASPPRVLRQRNHTTPNSRKRMVPRSLRSDSPEMTRRRGRPKKF